LFVLFLAACIDRQTAQRAIQGIQAEGARPDDVPVMLNRELPFRYPPDLYASKVQGNVTLRIHIDSTGAVQPDSTTIVESSGYPGLDSAALRGSRDLRFSPARQHGRTMGISLLLPIYFRHPRARPLPGDTILHRKPLTSMKP
jgi:protein TonB